MYNKGTIEISSGGSHLKFNRIKLTVYYVLFSAIIILLLEKSLRIFLDFASLDFYLEGFKVIIALYFILLFSEFKDRIINIGVAAIGIAFLLQFFLVFDLPRLVKPFLIFPCLIFLFGGLTLLLYGIYCLLQSNLKTSERLKTLALFDPLTLLPNRKYLFLECLYDDQKTCLNCKHPCEFHRCIFRSEEGAILFIDIDDFKLFNDYAGHNAGDRVLKLIAQRLKEMADTNDLVARLSGDEFVFVYNHQPHKDNIETFVQNLIHKMNEPLMIHGREVVIHCSVGISLFPKHGRDMETLIKKADIAMYESKRYGKNQYYIFEDEMENLFNQKFEQANELRVAVKNREFVVHYQKIANIHTGEVTSLEALVRWNHPKKGIIFPSEFIHLAEDIQVIDAIDQFVLETACSQINTWIKEKKKPYPISVNISPIFFMQHDFVSIIQSLLQKYHIDPSFLQLEITESVALRDLKRTKNILEHLKALRLTIHIDDFGKGYSSFNYIKEFPFDYIKIDKSFIDGIEQNEVDSALITLITDLSKTLNFRVISEGVETPNQLEFLKRIGCDEYQGYILNKPMPIEELNLSFEPLKE